MEGTALSAAQQGAIRTLKGTTSLEFFYELKEKTPSQAAQSLDVTRKQVYDAIKKNPSIAEQLEATWAQVWIGFRREARHPFTPKESDDVDLTHLCYGANDWDTKWSHLSELTQTSTDGKEGFLPMRSLSLCFYYASYVANVYRYARATINEEAPVEDAVTRYHEQVEAVLRLLKERAGRPILEVSILTSPSKVKHHIFHQLFGYPKQSTTTTAQDKTARLYLPAQLLFHSWTSVNIDGRAFRLYHVMHEFDWIARVGWPRSLKAIRLEYLDNTVSLGKVLSIPTLKELYIWGAQKGIHLFDKEAAALSDVSKLVLANMPSLASVPKGLRFLRLKDLHLENVSSPKFPFVKFFEALLIEAKGLKTLTLCGPQMVLPPDIDTWLQVPKTVSRLSLKNLQGLTSLPHVTSQVAHVELVNVVVPLISYTALLSAASPVKLMLDSIKLLVPPPERYPDLAPTVKVLNKEELRTIVSTGAAASRLEECTFSGFPEITDFQHVFPAGHMASLRKLHIFGSVGRLSVSIKTLPSLAELVIDKAKGVTLAERLSPVSLAYWTRQQKLLAAGAGGAPIRKLDFGGNDKGKEEADDDGPVAIVEDEDEEVPVSDTIAALEYMLIPFGAGRDKMTGRLEIPPWLPRNLETMPDSGLFASTWLEWDTAVSQWLASESNDEGLLLFPAIGDLRVTKHIEMDDGEPKTIVFTTAGIPLARQPKKDATEAEKKMFLERNTFLAGLPSQEFPVILRYLRKERVIGRDEKTGTVLTSDGINLSFPLEPRTAGTKKGERDLLKEPSADIVYGGILFDSDEFVDERDGLSKSCRIGFHEKRTGVRLDLGKLTLLYRREDDPIPSGFTFRITVATALRVLALQSIVLMTHQDISLQNKLQLGGGAGDEDDVSDDALLALSHKLAIKMTAFRPGEYQRQLFVLSALATARGVATETPFFFDETNEEILEAVRYDPHRQIMQGSLLFVYAIAIGMRHLLALKKPRGSDGRYDHERLSLLHYTDFRDHLLNVVMPDYLVPVASWCIAWSPADDNDGGVSGESQLQSVEGSATAFISLLQEMGSRLLNPLDAGGYESIGDAYAFVLEQLIPAPDLPDDDEVVAFSATREAFSQLVSKMIDDAVSFSEEVRTRLTVALTTVDRQLNGLTAAFLEAKTKHSGDGEYLDTDQVARYVKSVYPADRLQAFVNATTGAVAEIVRVVKSTVQQEIALEEQMLTATTGIAEATVVSQSSSFGLVSEPQRKRFKADLRADARSPTSPEKPVATLIGLLPMSRSPPRAKMVIKTSPGKSAVIDLVTPPRSPSGAEDDERDNVIDLTTPPRRMSISPSLSSSSTASSQLSSGERQRREDRRLDAEQEEQEERDELEAIREAEEEEEARQRAAAAAEDDEEGMSEGEKEYLRKEREAEKLAAAEETQLKAKKLADKTKSIKGAISLENICGNCGDTDTEKSICTRCRSAYYCDSACQRADWLAHKNVCNGITGGSYAAAAAAAAVPDYWMLLYARTGGFAGIPEVRRISSDGRMTVSRSGKLVADTKYEGNLNELYQWALSTPSVPRPGCCDHFTYAIELVSTDENGIETAVVVPKKIIADPDTHITQQ